MASYIIITVLAYLIGSINFSIIISKKMAGFDVREKGSGNAGTTNMLRSVGKKAAALTLVCDILKGVVAILLAIITGAILKNSDKALLVQLAGIAVVIGHTFPIFFGFKGGKGVATSLGVLLLINWKIGLICLVFAIVLMALTKMVSVGSVGAAILYPVLVLFIGTNFTVSEGSGYLVFSILLAVLVAFNHRENIKRILEGLNVVVTRLASGVPIGADMEYVDSLTLERALYDRKEIE
jgi:glycerol-3-phosphate acyltransferase PlsY